MTSNEMNKWVDDSEEEYEQEEIIQNHEPLPDIDKTFRDNVLKIKHSLYDTIVLSPELGTDDAQNKKVLQDYLDKLNKVYILSVYAENGKNPSENVIRLFPESSREAIRVTLNWIIDFFNKNNIPDTIPYSDYIRKSFHDYQFVQNNSFEEK